MTLQQLEYIVALDKYRHFVKAAESCHVTQSTLSMMVQKLEQELEISIFDRKAQPIAPTEIGTRLIDQAKVILYNAKQFKELALTEVQQESGKVTLGIIPTVAPYILPKLFKVLQDKNPNINLHVKEITTAEIINQLEKAELYAKRLLGLSIGTAIVGGLLVLAVRPVLLSWMNLTETVYGYLSVMLLITSYYIMGQSVNTMVVCGIFRAGGDVRFGLKMDIVAMWIYAVPVGFLAAFLFKLPPLWVYFILCLDEFVKMPVILMHYKKKKWLCNITRAETD